MAAPELTRPRLRHGSVRRCDLRRIWLCAYASLWLATLGVAATVAASGTALGNPVRRVLRLRLSAATNPPPSVGHAVALAAHNLPVAAWPLLLGTAGACRSRRRRLLADTTVIACLTINVLQVGAALGAYGTSLIPYLPQLPFEWAALAIGATYWITRRHHPLTLRDGLVGFALISCTLTVAAVLETAAVAHR
jgi:hypothetical protein